MKLRALIVIALLWYAGCSALGSPADATIDFPKGWRAPTASELSDAWRAEDSSRYALARGDFDGDSVKDLAVLLISTTEPVAGLFARLSGSGNKWNLLEQVTVGQGGGLGARAIAVANPGKYNLYCDPAAKQTDGCSAEWSRTVVIKHEAIDYWKFGSSSWLYIWDGPSKHFVRVTQGD